MFFSHCFCPYVGAYTGELLCDMVRCKLEMRGVENIHDVGRVGVVDLALVAAHRFDCNAADRILEMDEDGEAASGAATGLKVNCSKA